MKITCASSGFDFTRTNGDLNVVLYEHTDNPTYGSIGKTLKNKIVRRKLSPAPRAWDLLSLALAIISSDLAGHRNRSTDGWTREFDLAVSVADAPFWNANAALIEKMLAFLTTDRWVLHFIDGGIVPAPDRNAIFPDEDCVVLLSGGLDSYVGAIDLVSAGKKPFAVSQTVLGDLDKQCLFAAELGGGLEHMPLNHNAVIPNSEKPPSQRARSVIFLAYGVLIATTLAQYYAGEEVPLYVCENGFIAINPPLTGGRMGSLSTRTAHPLVLSLFQQILEAAGLKVRIVNPYRFKTKGEMLRECLDQSMLEKHAFQTTSCGRFKIFGHKHCGRCIPCLIRRSAIHAWKGEDQTYYKYDNLSFNDKDHAGFDDVRSALMGIAECSEEGIDRWLGATLSSDLVADKEELKLTVQRGLGELQFMLEYLGAR